jgi:hypothetical protein
MKTTKTKRTNHWAIFSRRPTTAHNPWLLLNLELFNFGDSVTRVVAQAQAQQFGR